MIQQKTHSQSGIVEIGGDLIQWVYENEIVISFQLSDVIVVGEYANSEGPHFDDWFLVFVTKDKSWFEISMYADNVDNLLKTLAEKYNAALFATQLANSTEWKSIVTYPLELSGQTLFELTRSEHHKLPKNIGQRLLHTLRFGNYDFSEEVALTQNVQQYIDSACR